MHFSSTIPPDMLYHAQTAVFPLACEKISLNCVCLFFNNEKSTILIMKSNKKCRFPRTYLTDTCYKWWQQDVF